MGLFWASAMPVEAPDSVDTLRKARYSTVGSEQRPKNSEHCVSSANLFLVLLLFVLTVCYGRPGTIDGGAAASHASMVRFAARRCRVYRAQGRGSRDCAPTAMSTHIEQNDIA